MVAEARRMVARQAQKEIGENDDSGHERNSELSVNLKKGDTAL
jgi:hypothetical protein